MTDPTARIPDRADEDRVVSRRVHHETEADPGDQDAYEAAHDELLAGTDTARGGDGSEGERAERDLDREDESEPTRSE